MNHYILISNLVVVNFAFHPSDDKIQDKTNANLAESLDKLVSVDGTKEFKSLMIKELHKRKRGQGGNYAEIALTKSQMFGSTNFNNPEEKVTDI